MDYLNNFAPCKGSNSKMMKKGNVLVLGALVAIGMSSCIKDGETYDPNAQYEIEKPLIETYAKAHMINPQFHEETGIWYEVITPGDPEPYQYKATVNPSNPSQSSIEAPDITVNYTGRLVQDNTVFDSDDEGFEVSLAGVIAAWQFAFLPEEIIYDQDGELLEEPIKFSNVGGLTPQGLGVGAVIHIVTPSLLAYRNQGQGKVPANAPLYFEIEVLDLTPPTEGSN